MAKNPRRRSGQKLRALMRTQEINDMLSKSITESEALQNTGDDRPTYESHVTDILDIEGGETKTGRKRMAKTRKAKPKMASKGKKKRRR